MGHGAHPLFSTAKIRPPGGQGFPMGIQHKPDMQAMQRIEELLREQLLAFGVDVSVLAPHEITAGMHCAVYPDGSLSYSWKGQPLLSAEPEELADGSIAWRFFTRPEPVQ